MTTQPDTHRAISGADILRDVPGRVLADALRALDEEGVPEAVVVHDFRKAIKRWRAILRLLAPFLGQAGAALNDEARDLARSLAGARDTRAALDALADLPDDPGLSPRSRATIKARLEEIGANAEIDLIAPATRAKLRSALAFAGEAAQRWPLDEIGFADIADELSGSYRRTRDALPKSWSAADSEQLHELRKRVVAYRHQMELVVPLWPKLGKLWIGETQRLRDRLGHHQDLEVLTRMSAPRQPLAPWRSRLEPLIAARQHAHVLASARLAGRLFAEKPRAFRRRLLALWESRAGAPQAFEQAPT